MVNQMLDMAKIEKGAMTVSFVRRDINKLLNYLVELFRSEAINRQIDLIFTSGNNPFEMDVDSDKIMHIISNLVSNALKFTSAGGRIEVSTKVVENGGLFLIQVTDSGIGIEKEYLAHLFDRFFRVESGNSRAGSGLGLALTKEMVELLKGTIFVESTPGEGTTFRILLPVTRNAKKHADMEDSDLIIGGIPQDGSVVGPAVPQKHRVESGPGVSDEESEAPLLLIVEDNPDVVQYLRAILKNEYRVEVAGNGNEGFEKALEIIPDIILSDVMMPVMDGIELLEKVKNEMRTSHIPVVMLTAKADVGSRLAGLEKGADAYLAKPFNEKELHVQLKSLIEIRRKLQEHYVSVTLQEIRSGAEASLDDQFMQKVISLMDRNLDDDQFGIAELCDALGMSRAQIYRKFRSLTDKTLHDYLRSYRLRKARELLLTTKLTVSEAAYRTGFKNLSHFSRVFTEEFGENPGN